MEKKCTLCLEVKPYDQFYNNKRAPDGKASRCKKCNRIYSDEWNKNNPERVRASWKKKEARYAETGIVTARRYKLSLEEYQALLRKYDGKCGICGKPTVLHIDHDHITGRVRGMLCLPCNTSLGQLGDNIEGLERAIEYLRAVSTVANALAS